MRAINMCLITSFSNIHKSDMRQECSVWNIIVFNEAHSHQSQLHTGDSKSRLTQHCSNQFHLGPKGSCIVFLVSVMRSW
ncbi:BQ5605_C005g03699 [Microbotryum silenes-dioicae]|uniref:BQ5605_C005g03699 protein n=1 Tax=Microbotryum silenes-dioicae TaxID=796604 RepID=A0A2X0MFN0_9BASI|nr:BQ5605_C005g03699 [Microbotryum silenes-dioicae]